MTDPASDLPQPEDLRKASDERRSELASRLYEQLGPRVLALGARYYPGDPEQAEELVAETFARVIVALPHFRGRSSYLTWVFSIALRVIQEGARRTARRRTSPVGTADRPVEGSGLHSALRRERDVRVRAALGKLSADHRIVLGLIAVEGLRHSEAAELLGVAEGTLWSRYARARVALAEALGPRGADSIPS